MNPEILPGIFGGDLSLAKNRDLGNVFSRPSALSSSVSGLGDRDTTCAIVGGIVASYTGVEGIPQEWLESRERLPSWPFVER